MGKYFFPLFFFLTLGLQAQELDTAFVYEGLSITYLQRADTVLISKRKLGDIVGYLREQQEQHQYWMRRAMWLDLGVATQDSIIAETQRMANVWKERSIMYEEMYRATYDDASKLHGSVMDCVNIASEERKKGRWQGAVFGAAGGLVIGAITAAILLR